MDLNKIQFGLQKDMAIFSDIAKQFANELKLEKWHPLFNKANKSTQLRKFYDELLIWNDRVQFNRQDRDGKYKELEPFIKMLKAKVAYARSRSLVDDGFLNMFNRCLDQVNNAETLKDSKLFLEAVISYYKLVE